MGDCSSTSHCNPCGPDFNAINQLASKTAVYARQSQTYSVDSENAATNAENALAEFQSIYLGAFPSDPAGPHQIGALYFNTTSNQLFTWNGTVWVVATTFNEFTTFLSTGTTVARNLVTRMSDVINLKDFGAITDSSITAAIAAAVAQNKIIGVDQSITVKVPTSAATLQIALDRLTPLTNQVNITLQIESGHTLTAGVSLQDRNCEQFIITSVDSEVPISFNTNIFAGINARMPVLSCLINAISQMSGNGVRLEGSEMYISPNCGIKNCWGNGLYALYGSKVSANNTIWSGCARNNTTGSCITSWASIVSAESSDCTNSKYYGAQAAHGGLLSFRSGNASNAYRHGIRATDAAIVDADLAIANNCGVDLDGRNVNAYEGGIVNFTNGTANGNLGTSSDGSALFAYGAGSSINARGATSTGNARCGARAQGGGVIRLTPANISASIVDIEEIDGVIYQEIGPSNLSYPLSESYIPSVTNVLNVSSTTSQGSQWLRVGKTVTVSGAITVVTTASGNTEFLITLPIPSNFTSFRQCAGTAIPAAFKTNGYCSILADTTNDRAQFRMVASSADTFTLAYTFTYIVT